jgi:hypothetical protein
MAFSNTISRYIAIWGGRTKREALQKAMGIKDGFQGSHGFWQRKSLTWPLAWKTVLETEEIKHDSLS